MENDVNPPSLESSASLRIMPKVTQGNDQVAEVDADDDEDQEQIMGDVLKSSAVRRPRRNTRKPSWLTIDRLSPMLFRLLMRQSRLHTEKLKSVQSQICGKMPWKKR